MEGVEKESVGSKRSQPIPELEKPSLGSERKNSLPAKSPTSQKKNMIELLNRKVDELRQEIGRLNEGTKFPRTDKDGLYTSLDKDLDESGLLDGKNEVNKMKLIPFRAKFKKIPYDKELPARVVRLVHKVRKLSSTYDHMSLVCALDAALPHEMADTYNESGSADLEIILNELMTRYNSPTLIEEAERSLFKFNGEGYRSLSEKMIAFFAKVASFNKRCALAGLRYQRRIWDRTRAFNYVCIKLLKYHRQFRKELFRLWVERADKIDVETWSEEDIRSLLTRAELLSSGGMAEVESRFNRLTTSTQSHHKLASIEIGNKRKVPCFRCGALNEIVKGPYQCRSCFGKKKVECTIEGCCSKSHATRFHDLACNYSKKRKGNIKRYPSIQGTEQMAALESESQAGSMLEKANCDSDSEDTVDECAALWEISSTESWSGIRMKLAGHVVGGLLDCGAQFCAISGSFYDRVLKPLGIPELSITKKSNAVDGRLIDTRARVLLTVEIGKEILEVPFRVLEGITTPVIIGNNVLKLTTQDGPQSQLTLGESKVMIEDYHDKIKTLCDSPKVCELDEIYLIEGYNGNSFEEPAHYTVEEKKTPGDEKVVEELLRELKDITEGRLANCKTEVDTRKVTKEANLMKEIVRKHVELFAKSFRAGQLKIPPVKLRFNEDIEKVRPKISKLKALSNKELRIVKQWIEEGVQAGVLEPSHSTWRSSVFPVRKPDLVHSDGSKEEQWRCVTPYYELNKLLNVQGTPMPTMNDVRQAVSGCDYFTVIDLKQGFFQIPLSKESRPFTAFGATGTRLFQYRCIPMGCTVSVSLMQQAITSILASYYFNGCIIYCDDILVYSMGGESKHLELVNEILECLKLAGTQIKMRKVKLAKTEVLFLGLKLSREGWEIAPKFMEALQATPIPETLRALRSFVGLVNWQRSFVNSFSHILAPLNNLIKRAQKEAVKLKQLWTSEHTLVFNKVKRLMKTAPVLKHPDFKVPFCLYTDASDYAIGGVLVQSATPGDEEDHSKAKNILGFHSRKFNKTEMNYSIAEKELVALVESAEAFKPFVFGYKLFCFFDQRSILWLLQKEVPGKFWRYRVRLTGYNPVLRFVQGNKNMADWVSRFAGYAQDTGNTVAALVREQKTTNNDNSNGQKEIAGIPTTVDYGKTDLGSAVTAAFLNGDDGVTFRRYKYNLRDFERKGSLWMYRGKVVVPAAWRNAVLTRVHCQESDSAHQGIQRTFIRMREQFYWPNLRQDVIEFIMNCDVCLQAKARVIKVPLRHLEIPKRKFEVIVIDIFGEGALSRQPQGRMILSVQDRLTNFVQLYPMRKKNWKPVGNVLRDKWFNVFGKPVTILLDNGFESEESKKWSLENEVALKFCSAYDHRQIGSIERFHRYLGDQVRVMALEEGKGAIRNAWPSYLSVIAMRYNMNALSGLTISPYELVFGSRAAGIVRLDRKEYEYGQDQRLLKELEKKAEEFRYKEFGKRANKLKVGQTTHRDTLPGTLIWWKKDTTVGGKFKKAYGPYEVLNKLSDKLFECRHSHTGRKSRISAEQAIPVGIEWEKRS